MVLGPLKQFFVVVEILREILINAMALSNPWGARAFDKTRPADSSHFKDPNIDAMIF